MMILLATVILGALCYQEVSAGRHDPVRVTRSAVESLRDRGTYIICFKDHVTEEELQQFTATLLRSSDEDENFKAEIIEGSFSIRCLTARLSEKALSWVRLIIYLLYIFNTLIILVIYANNFRKSTLPFDHFSI